MADEHEPGRIEETALPILNNGLCRRRADKPGIPLFRLHGQTNLMALHDGVHEAYSYVVMLRKNSRFRK